MKKLIRKVLIVLFVCFFSFILISCKKDEPVPTPNPDTVNIENFDILLEIGEEKKIELNKDYKYDVVITNEDIVSFTVDTFKGLREGKTTVTITTVDDKTFKQIYAVTVVNNNSSEFDEELVIDIPNNLYANQTISYEVKTKDGKVVDDYEIELDNDEVVEFYPVDNEFATLEAGTVVATFTATIDGKRYGKVITLNVLAGLSLNITVNDTITTEKPLSYQVFVMPDNIEVTDYVVDSSDKKVFTITSGELTPVAPGKALIIISCTYNGAKVSASKQIVVTEYIADYLVTNIDDFLILNDNLNVKAIIKPSNTEVNDLVITSSDENVIIAGSSTIFGKAKGTATVTVKAHDLEVSYQVEVIEVESIDIVIKDTIYLHEVTSFEVIAKPSNKVINKNSAQLEYKTDNDNVLNNDHAIFGNNVGSTELVVTLYYSKSVYQSSFSNLQVTKTINVVEKEIPVERLTISTGAGMIVGSTEDLVITRYPENGKGDIVITSSASDVIEVDGTKLKALKEGKSEIKATLVGNNSVYAVMNITVIAKKEKEVVSDGLFKGEPVTASYEESSIKYYYELMGGVTETTYIGYTTTELDGDVDGYSGMTGEIVHNEPYAQNVHVLEVPSRQDVVVVPWANLNNHVWSLTTVKGLIGNFEEHNPGYKVIAAVNGDFFDINANKNLPYSTTGESISNGEFYKVTNGFSGIGGTLGFTNDGSTLTLVAGANTSQKYSDYFVLDIYDENDQIIKSFNIYDINKEPAENGIALFYGTYNDNKDYESITTPSSNTFVVENAILALPSDDLDFYGKGVISGTSQKELDVGEFAITTNNQELLPYLQVGTKIRCQRVFVGEFTGVTSATGYNGVVFDEDGIFDFNANGNLSNRAPRTVIGMKEDGTLVMMVVDGRQGLKDMYGCDGYELTAIMRAYGCIKAYNVDGGGSSTIVVRSEKGLEVLNSPSDGHERSDGNCILICMVDPNYETNVKDIKKDSAIIEVKTANANYQDYEVYVSLDNEMYKVENGEVKISNLVHNNTYGYRVYYKKNNELIATQSVGSFTTPKDGFMFLGLYIEEKENSFVLSGYSIDNDHAGNVHEMTVIVNGKRVNLKQGTLEIDKKIYGETIEKIGYEYWFNSENGRETVTVLDGLYFLK